MIFSSDALTRRDFLARSATITGGLVVAFHVPKIFRSEALAAEASKNAFPPNAFLKIASDDTITLTVNRLEMGQGVNTAFAQLMAEELGCAYERIQAVASNSDSIYNTPGMPFIITGGSMSVRTSWEQYRKIGAGMREMLKAAAAKRWGVEIDSLHANDGKIMHAEKGSLSFGTLAEEASQFPFPENPKLKSPSEFKVIGKSKPRVDAESKTNGKAVFGMDVRLPGMLYAMVAKPPLPGSKLISYDEKAARKISGVTDVVRFSDRVAVLAKNTHAAHLGQAALQAQWNSGVNAKASTLEFMNHFKAEALKLGIFVQERGHVEAQLKKSKQKLLSITNFRFLPMRPWNP